MCPEGLASSLGVSHFPSLSACSSIPAGRRPGRIPRRCCGCKRAGGGDLPETSLGLVWKGREVAYQALDPDLVVVVDVVVQVLLEVLMVLVIQFLTALQTEEGVLFICLNVSAMVHSHGQPCRLLVTILVSQA